MSSQDQHRVLIDSLSLSTLFLGWLDTWLSGMKPYRWLRTGTWSLVPLKKQPHYRVWIRCEHSRAVKVERY